jgi:ribonuclease P protein component
MRVNTFPSKFRLKKRRDFAQVQRYGRSMALDKIVIQWKRSSNDHTRLGLTVSSRFGSAVERNLFRRRAKEAFRVSTLKAVPGLDLNVKPRGAGPVTYQEFCQAFQKIERIINASC